MNSKRQAKAEWQQLATGEGGARMPPRTPTEGLTVEPPDDNSLTRKFNRAADPTQKEMGPEKQIDMLRRKMSQPKATLEMGMRGSVTRAYQPNRDRRIAKQIANLVSQMQKAEKQVAKSKDIKLGESNQLTPKFNRASGMEM